MPETDPLYFLHESQTGQIIRNVDWVKTELGPPELWPVELKNSISHILLSKIPIYLYWGENNRQFYNDAMIPNMQLLGKHPEAICEPAANIWPQDFWAQHKSTLDTVHKEKKSTWFEAVPIPLQEGFYWTFSHIPVLNEHKEVSGIMVYVWDETEKINYQKRASNFQQRFLSIADSSELGILYIEKELYTIEYTNETYASIHDYSVNEILGKKLFDISPNAEENYGPLLKDIVEHKKHINVNGRPYLHKRLNKHGFVNVHFQPLIEQDEVQGIFVIIQDVTPQIQATQEIEKIVAQRTSQLEEANLKLEKSNAELEQFAYIASHDLQEPIRKITSYTQLLEKELKEQLGDKAQHYLERIAYSSERMRLLVGDLLSLARVNAQNIDQEEVDLNEVLHFILQDFELKIEQQNVRVKKDILPKVMGAYGHLEQLFANLISNALKFMPEHQKGQLSITCTTLKEEDRLALRLENGMYHEIIVADNGIGFEQKDAEKIFEAFQRLHNQTEYSGTGIGLALCKKIALQHGGEIFATSQLGKGAAFHVVLPVI